MRRLLALALAFLPGLAAADIYVFAGGAFSRVSTTPQVQVPDVVGLDLADADTALEAEELDTGNVTAVCSVAPLDEVLSQNPAAGSFVNPGSLVDLTASSGVACAWNFSGIPTGWYSIANVLAEQDFMREARVEADGAAVWAYWLPGVPRGTANLRLNLPLIRAEADGAAAWARWAPGTQPGNTGNLQLNMILALEANFQ